MFEEESSREWAREHRCEATKPASAFVARLLRDKAANHRRVHGAPARGGRECVGISVETSVLDDLSRLTREKWPPPTLLRLSASALGARKSDEIDLLEAH